MKSKEEKEQSNTMRTAGSKWGRRMSQIKCSISRQPETDVLSPLDVCVGVCLGKSKPRDEASGSACSPCKYYSRKPGMGISPQWFCSKGTAILAQRQSVEYLVASAKCTSVDEQNVQHEPLPFLN